MTKRITIWLDEGKPTKVKTTNTDEFYIEDLSKLVEAISKRGGEQDVVLQRTTARSDKY